MRLVSFLEQGDPRYGVLVDGAVVDVDDCLQQAPATINEFIAFAVNTPGSLQQLVEVSQHKRSLARPLGQLTLLPCVPRPSKILCLGVNYHDHAAEGGNKIADFPAIFLRGPSSLVGHRGAIPVPAVSDKLDFEAELALVVGRPAYRVSEAQALNHVFAYSCFNDATLRDYQRKTSQWTIGKNFDLTGGFGPHLVTADELPAGCKGLRIESRLNGQVMQSATTSDMVFHVAQTISLISQCMTLEPGDVIVMGTPAGVGYARNPPVWMRPGDIIEIEIEQIGILCNDVVDRARS
jgi:2-keto-4-pentenoate hydratase/2-oxohepta-3-ene-1,7-dioic acid hydratase in catechol pathway